MAEMRDKVKGAIDDAAEKGKNLTDRAANAAERAGNDVQRAGNQASNQGHGLVHDVQAAVSNAAGTVQDKAQQWAGQAGDKAQQWAGDVADTATQYGRQAQRWVGEHAPDSFGDAGQEIVKLVRQYPIPALLVGFGVGLLVGRAART